MSICEKNREILEAFSWGLSDLQGFDQAHARWCARCRSEYQEAVKVNSVLLEYAAEVGAVAAETLESRPLEVPLNLPRQEETPAAHRVSFSRPLRWMAMAATVVIAFLAGYFYRSQPPVNPGDSLYLAALTAEGDRFEVVSYLRRSELYLLSLLDEAHDCSAETLAAERELARRLVFQKQLLEPKFETVGVPEVKALVDEIEVLLLDLSTADHCPHEEIQSWREVLESRSTLRKLNLYQMEDRI